MMSAPSLMNVLVSRWPAVRSVKLPVKLPFWVFSLQPRTLTFLWCLVF
jgi:hypothetical protein